MPRHEHDFVRFPELTNKQMQEMQFKSPHKQIYEDFICDVVKVIDGDTIRVRWAQRDFDFPVRLLDIDAPEVNEKGGLESKLWLKGRIEGERVMVHIEKSRRVDKWGRLLGHVYSRGLNVGQAAVWLGKAIPFGQRNEREISNSAWREQ